MTPPFTTYVRRCIEGIRRFLAMVNVYMLERASMRVFVCVFLHRTSHTTTFPSSVTPARLVLPTSTCSTLELATGGSSMGKAMPEPQTDTFGFGPRISVCRTRYVHETSNRLVGTAHVFNSGRQGLNLKETRYFLAYLRKLTNCLNT